MSTPDAPLRLRLDELFDRARETAAERFGCPVEEVTVDYTGLSPDGKSANFTAWRISSFHFSDEGALEIGILPPPGPDAPHVLVLPGHLNAPVLVPRHLLNALAPEQPINQDEQGGCVWCGGMPPRTSYGYARRVRDDHMWDCPWVSARSFLGDELSGVTFFSESWSASDVANQPDDADDDRQQNEDVGQGESHG
jgi:hypothetical protein